MRFCFSFFSIQHHIFLWCEGQSMVLNSFLFNLKKFDPAQWTDTNDTNRCVNRMDAFNDSFKIYSFLTNHNLNGIFTVRCCLGNQTNIWEKKANEKQRITQKPKQFHFDCFRSFRFLSQLFPVSILNSLCNFSCDLKFILGHIFCFGFSTFLLF